MNNVDWRDSEKFDFKLSGSYNWSSVYPQFTLNDAPKVVSSTGQ